MNYNGGEVLRRCLRSLEDEGQRDREIVLVDNASTDGSVEWAGRECANLRLIRNRQNQGFGQGCNLGAESARGQYLAFLNPDTVVEPGWVEALITALDAAPTAGLTTSRILLLADPERVNTCGNDVHISGLTLCRGSRLTSEAMNEPVEVDAISGAAFAVRRDLFDSLGGFDPAFFMYLEDTDLSLRARLAGYRCLYVPKSVVYHDYTLRFGPRKIYYEERNRYVMLLKNLRWLTLLALVPSLLLAEAVVWGFVLLRERRQVTGKLRAYAWMARHWSEVVASRRRAQALRRVRDRDLIEGWTYRLAFEQTGDGTLARMAHAVFDSSFSLLRRLTLFLVRW